MSVLDAMALGVPVIAAAVGELPELIGADERGLLGERHDPVRWDAAIRRMLADDNAHLRRVDAARKFAQKSISPRWPNAI